MLLAVYGTLKKNKINHKYLEESKFIGEDYLKCYWFDQIGNVPAGCFVKNNSRELYIELKVEVYDIDEKLLKTLDKFEFGDFEVIYDRVIVKTLILGPNLYVYNQNGVNGKINKKYLRLESDNKYCW